MDLDFDVELGDARTLLVSTVEVDPLIAFEKFVSYSFSKYAVHFSS